MPQDNPKYTRWLPVGWVYLGVLRRHVPDAEIARGAHLIGLPRRGVRWGYSYVQAATGKHRFAKRRRLWIVYLLAVKATRKAPKPVRLKWLTYKTYIDKVFMPEIRRDLPDLEDDAKKAEVKVRQAVNDAARRWESRLLWPYLAVAVPPRYISPTEPLIRETPAEFQPVMGRFGVPRIPVNYIDLSFIIKYGDGRYGYENVFFWLKKGERFVRVKWKTVYRNLKRYVSQAIEILSEGYAPKRKLKGRPIKSGSAHGAEKFWFLYWESYYKPPVMRNEAGAREA